MRIVTTECPDCGTVVAGNVLERNRVMQCPGLDCDAVRRFDDLSAEDREYVEAALETFRTE